MSGKEAKAKTLDEAEKDADEHGGLCWRCEYRAQFHEMGFRPRLECGDVSSSKWSCYMYRPVRPLVLQANDGDKRPLGGPAFISSRAHRVCLGDVELRGRDTKAGLLQYWAPKEAVDGKAKASRAGQAGSGRRKTAGQRRRTGRKLG